jgi:hypothetical protein
MKFWISKFGKRRDESGPLRRLFALGLAILQSGCALNDRGTIETDGQPATVRKAEVAAELERTAEELSRSDSFIGVVLLPRHGQPLGPQAFGMADRQAGIENTLQTTERVFAGVMPAEYGGSDGLGFETRTVNGVRSVGHRWELKGTSNQVEFYPDLGYVLVVLGNSDARGTQEISEKARSRAGSLAVAAEAR